MNIMKTDDTLPLAMQGGLPPMQNLSSEDLDRVAGGTISWNCEGSGDDRVCKAADCD